MSENKDHFKAQYGDEHEVSKALDSPNSEIVDSTMNNHIHSAANLTTILGRNPNYDTATRMLGQDNINSGHITQALSHPHDAIKIAAMGHASVDSDHINKALDGDISLRMKAICHRNASSDNIYKALKDKDSNIRCAALRNPNVTPDHIDKALDDTDFEVTHTAAGHPKVSTENITKILKGKMGEFMQVTGNKKLTSGHIDTMLSNVNPKIRIFGVLHPNTTKKHFEKAANDTDSNVSQLAKNKLEQLNKS